MTRHLLDVAASEVLTGELRRILVALQVPPPLPDDGQRGEGADAGVGGHPHFLVGGVGAVLGCVVDDAPAVGAGAAALEARATAAPSRRSPSGAGHE